jgi:hypothetical protein
MFAVFTRKRLILSVCMIVLGASAGLLVNYLNASASEQRIARYYAVLDAQEVIKDDVLVTIEDMNAVNRCKNLIGATRRSADECMRKFYDDYAMEHGVEDAFSHMARLGREQPDLLANCHYISHGIGHAAFRLSGNDAHAAFSLMNAEPLYKNIATCGNGYFHGIAEELARGVTDQDDLVAVLSNACAHTPNRNKGSCFHGIGHAALIQLDYDVDRMTGICDRVSRAETERFDCLTGGFMEDAQYNPDAVVYESGTFRFVRCEAMPAKYQVPCYLEHSGLMDTREQNLEYREKIGRCKMISDDLNRMACVKLFAIRAVRIAHYKDIKEMCKNTSSVYESVMCTAIVADRVGASIDNSRQSDEYAVITQDICGTLTGAEKEECLYLARENRVQLFFTSEADLAFAARLR